MGIILSTLSEGGGKREPVDIFLDFEKAQPETDEEKEIYGTVAKVLDQRADILQKLKEYKGCEEFIRQAITNPSDESEEQAWASVLPAVERLKEFYDFSLELENCFPNLLVALCKENPKEKLQTRQALSKQFADVFDFVLQFDDLKMLNPAIQNDFSYYRRTLNRMRLSKKHHGEITIKDELANRMSLFFAYPTPMMNVINETTAKFLSQNTSVPQENVTTALAIMATICEEMVAQKKFTSDETNMFCLRWVALSAFSVWVCFGFVFLLFVCLFVCLWRSLALCVPFFSFPFLLLPSPSSSFLRAPRSYYMCSLWFGVFSRVLTWRVFLLVCGYFFSLSSPLSCCVYCFQIGA
jgi:CYRIA/CYRIB Rac1 binding domain